MRTIYSSTSPGYVTHLAFISRSRIYNLDTNRIDIFFGVATQGVFQVLAGNVAQSPSWLNLPLLLDPLSGLLLYLTQRSL